MKTNNGIPSVIMCSLSLSQSGSAIAQDTGLGGGGSMEGKPSLLGFNWDLPDMTLASLIRLSNSAFSCCNSNLVMVAVLRKFYTHHKHTQVTI